MVKHKTKRRLAYEQLDYRRMFAITFVDSLQTIGPETTYTAAFADLDGDKDLDASVLELNQPAEIWLNEGDGRFVDSGERLGPTASVSAAMGDLDGDGDIDAVVQAYDVDGFGNHVVDSPTVIWINDGRARFDSKPQSEELSGLGVTKMLDMDGDGDLDLLDSGMRLWINNGEGEFRRGDRLGNFGTETDFSVADLDGDEDFDVVIPSFVFFSDIRYSAGTLHKEGLQLRPQHGFSFSALSASCGDVDGDGEIDIVFSPDRTDAGPFQEVAFVYLNDGQGNFRPSDNTTKLRRFAMVVGDVDADGDLDIVTGYSRYPDGYVYELWPNDGLGSFRESDRIKIADGNGGPHVILVDVDSDGDLDVFANGQLWLTNGSSAFHFAGDANGDGHFDQADIVQVLQFDKYRKGQPATWKEGDWNRDGLFDQIDIVTALGTGHYLQGLVLTNIFAIALVRYQ